MKKIAIIGGGPAGLCAARHLLHSKGDVKLQPVIFEQQESIGGTWLYKDVVGVDMIKEKQFTSAIYKNLKTNLPKEVMCFPDFPFPDADPSYMHHSSVLKYMQNYADHFKLNQYINFNTKVVYASPLLADGKHQHGDKRFVKWLLQSENLLSNEMQTEEYDGVVVCSGHYSKPVIPDIKGLQKFNGEVLHSKFYRDPKKYAEKSVIVVGHGPSAIDITCDLSKVCPKIYLCKRSDGIYFMPIQHPSNVTETENVKEINECGEVLLESGLKISADVILLCTGYAYEYPFLASNSQVVVKESDKVVTPLYKHIFHTVYPSMAFVGLLTNISPAPLMHQQCAYISSVFSENKVLPTKTEMTADTEIEIAENKSDDKLFRYFHAMGAKQFVYEDELADLSGNEKTPDKMKNLFFLSAKDMLTDIYNFKTKNYDFTKSNL